MKYRALPRFLTDYRKLSASEKARFRDAFARFINACKEYEDNPQHYVWPASLRIEKLAGTGIMAMTGSFSGPDGRATFQFETVEGEMFVLWRRVGRHSVYAEP